VDECKPLLDGSWCFRDHGGDHGGGTFDEGDAGKARKLFKSGPAGGRGK
jgi:hypothetical protein